VRLVLDRFYERMKHEPCLVCGRHGVDIAHLRPVSIKVRDWTMRSHKDWRAFTAIPLCKDCHDTLHVLGEKWLDEKLPGGRRFAYSYALSMLSQVVEEVCTDDGR